jgi:selenocysteine-specific elongation factor
MHVIGTAGHVDHGKSTLVKALTGIDPDRLAEEKEREMTIDLGFAWVELEVGSHTEEVGIVDVPGHRDFIENMLAGIGGIDVALLVVAADEGVMPQTREHLAILDLLQVPQGIIALTKVDLVEDEEWLELVTLDLLETVSGTCLEDAPIVPVSAKTGTGVEELRRQLSSQLESAEAGGGSARPRLPIDRVFTLSGFGTVVTGTLLGGSFRVGDTVELLPDGLQGRIRGLQSHKTQREVVYSGSRVAVNVSGISADEVARGDVLAAPGLVRGTILIDVAYRHLPEAGFPLKHNTEVKIFVGAAETIARTRVLGQRTIEPGSSGWLQLVLQEPLALLPGDRFILRRPSPGATIGGGRILDPHPGRRHRRFRPEVIKRLQTLAEGTPAERLLETLRRDQPLAERELMQQPAMEKAVMEEALATLVELGEVHRLGNYLLTAAYRDRLLERLTTTLTSYHQSYPLRRGMPREELRSRLALDSAFFNLLLQTVAETGDAPETGDVVEDGSVVRLPDHEIRFTPQQQQAITSLMARFEESKVNSPSVREARDAAGNEVYEALLELGELKQLNEEVVYRSQDYHQLIEQIVTFALQNETINVGEVRDMLDTSRKYAIALLEHLDQQRITRRAGDDRTLQPHVLRERQAQ